MSRANETIWRQTLAKLADREDGIEVTPLMHDAERIDTTYRTRVLAFDATTGNMAVETLVDATLNPDDEVELLIQAGPHRYRGICNVLETKPFRLNQGTVVEAVHLAPPREIESAQRRSFFRVATAGAPIDHVEISPAGLPDHSVGVSLVNISAGGIGVSLPATAELARTLPRARHYDCVIRLPILDDPIRITARLVHFQLTPQRVLYLGLEFTFRNDKHREEIEDHIAHFNAHQQRQQLRRQRGTAV